MELIQNTDTSAYIAYQIARTVYAETGACTLRAVEALCSMIANIATHNGRDYMDIVTDSQLFDSRRDSSPRKELLSVSANDRGLQMCLRVVRRMMRGGLADTCHGATRFHHADVLPAWAVARGYIADIDGLLFYL